MGFLIAVVWIMVIADEVVSVLKVSDNLCLVVVSLIIG